ncbi:hypothetical protein AC1031_010928 [Aphanomyces cochlioides]|nr:hypothetical protein AC1031_010928 [Aphanomyces cochlioides]
MPEEDTPEFSLGDSSGQSPEVIVLSSNEGSSVSSGPSDLESEEEEKEAAATGPPTKGQIDEQGVQRLNHIDLPVAVKMAYIHLERKEPWVQWLAHFRSFLPGLTEAQRLWNSRWYNFWQQYGEVVWQRYFFVGVGQYRTNPLTVHPTAQTSRRLLERAKSKIANLIAALKDMEGLEVFEFLFFNVHPFWPELAQDPCSLRGLAEVVPDGATRAIQYMRHYGHSRFPDFSQYPRLMGPRVMAKYTFGEAVVPGRHVSWAWKILIWCARNAGDTATFVPALAQRLNSGLAAQRTEPFPYVQYADETCCRKPEWLARQDEVLPNLQGLYVAGSGSARAILRATGQEVEGSDVSGIPSGTITL